MKKQRRNWTFRKSVYGVFKRLFDILISLFGIIISSPIMIIVAIAIKLDSKGPAIFKQERTGRFGKTFNVWKFRTMAITNDVHDFSQKD